LSCHHHRFRSKSTPLFRPWFLLEHLQLHTFYLNGRMRQPSICFVYVLDFHRTMSHRTAAEGGTTRTRFHSSLTPSENKTYHFGVYMGPGICSLFFLFWLLPFSQDHVEPTVVEFQEGFTWLYFVLDDAVISLAGLVPLPAHRRLDIYRPSLGIGPCRAYHCLTSQFRGPVDVPRERAYTRKRLLQPDELTSLSHSTSPGQTGRPLRDESSPSVKWWWFGCRREWGCEE